MITWKLALIIVLLTLSVVDLAWTYYYVHTYKKWQPEKPYKLIELNPLLVFLWSKLGLHLGMFVGSVIILTLNYLVAKYAHPIVSLLVLGFLIFAMFNHSSNTTLLHMLMEKYPTGYLPTEVFGVVEGSNSK